MELGTQFWWLMDFGERLKTVRGDDKQEAFAKRLGVHKNTIGRWERGDQSPGVEDLNKILELNPNINPTWLLTGEGQKERQEVAPTWWFNDGENLGDKPVEQAYSKSASAVQDDYLYLPLYNVRASAGGGTIVDTEQVLDVLAFKQTWIRSSLGLNPANLYLIYVEGESMEPTLRSGDLIMIDRYAQLADAIFVVLVDNTLLVKRLQRLPGRFIKLSSDNPAFESFTINQDSEAEGVSIIGKVVWSARRM